MNRAHKTKILDKLLLGETALLRQVRTADNQDLSKMSTKEILKRHERLRLQIYQQTGIMPPAIIESLSLPSDQIRERIQQIKETLQP